MKINKNIRLDKKILEAQDVDIALIFGSCAAGLTHPNSDIDIGIVFLKDKKRKQKPVEVYGCLYEECRKKFQAENVDIVYLEESPLSLQFQAINDGIILYEKSPSSFADYKEKVMKKYFDFKYIEDIFNQAITKTI